MKTGLPIATHVLLSTGLVLALLGGRLTVAEEATSSRFPGAKSDWHGFARYDFQIAGKPVLVVAPQQAAAGQPWVWHGEFFGHKPAPDIELLKRGFHVVYTRIPDMLGCPDAVAHWNRVYEELTQSYGFSQRVALVGLSRGGLYCYNWAVANPDKVACIYGDAPVCDFKSWPGGRGAGKGSARDWQLVLQRYGFENDAAALAYEGNPIDRLAPLAEARVPLLHVYGEADDVVPWDENTGVLAERYRLLGGSITLIAKPGVGHHPHGLDDPSPIVEFIARHAQEEKTPPAYQKTLVVPGETFSVRGRSAFIFWPREEDRRQPQPWIMYAPTLPPYPDQHEKWMHEKFLAAGIAVAGIDAGEAYGSPNGQSLMTALYDELTQQKGFARKPCLLGRSRGGLWVASWAISNPDKVAGMAGIYPVFDLRSYPSVANAAPAFELSPGDLEARLNEFNPIARAGVLARARLPVFIIHGNTDQVVPLEANSAALAQLYQAESAADVFTLKVAEGQGHNLWEGFFRSQPLVDFAIRQARRGAGLEQDE